MALLSTPKKTTELATPLPVTNRVLNGSGVTLRRGQFSLLASGPGVGKTLFATNLAVRTPIPTVYFSADSDEWTVKSRAVSILTGHELTTVEKNYDSPAWAEFYEDSLAGVDHVDWCFQTDIDPEFIVLRLQAYAEIRGEYPALVVVDNLGNTVVEQDNEGSELRNCCREMQRIARSLNCHVMALHHVVGPKEDGYQQINLGDILFKLSKIPETVFGLHRMSQSELGLSIPKQRGGKAGMVLSLPVNYATATIGGYTVG